MNAPKPTMGTFKPAAHYCEHLEISRTTWWRWTKTPGFPEPIRFGRSVRWPVAAVERFLTQQEA